MIINHHTELAHLLQINVIGTLYGDHDDLIQPFARYSSLQHHTSASSVPDICYYSCAGCCNPGIELIVCLMVCSTGLLGSAKISANSDICLSHQAESPIDKLFSPSIAVSTPMVFTVESGWSNIAKHSTPVLTALRSYCQGTNGFNIFLGLIISFYMHFLD